MTTQADRLEGKRLIIGTPYRPTAKDNAKAWEAIEPLLAKAGDKGVRYEHLDAAARRVPSITRQFIPYLVRAGNLKVIQQG